MKSITKLLFCAAHVTAIGRKSGLCGPKLYVASLDLNLSINRASANAFHGLHSIKCRGEKDWRVKLLIVLTQTLLGAPISIVVGEQGGGKTGP